jgi:hypothetical protein
VGGKEKRMRRKLSEEPYVAAHPAITSFFRGYFLTRKFTLSLILFSVGLLTMQVLMIMTSACRVRLPF